MTFTDNDIRKLINLGVLNKPEQSDDFKQTYGSVVSIDPIMVVVDGSTSAISYGIKNFSGVNITIGSRVILARMGSEFVITGVNHLVGALMLKDNAITSETNIGSLESGIYKVSSSNSDFPTSSAYYGTLLSFAETAYKAQILLAGVSGESELYFRRYFYDSAIWSSWIKVQGENQSLAVPVGTIVPFAGNTVPAGWLWCRGGAISRTTYAELFAIIGTTYGSGDGSTTFNVPDLRGKFPLGYSSSHDVASSGGEETHKLTTDEIPAHTHGSKSLTGSASAYKDTGIMGESASPSGIFSKTDLYSWGPSWEERAGYGLKIDATHTHDSVGGSNEHNNMPPYLTLNYIIYAGV